MADRKQNAKNNRRRHGSDDDFNPRFRKVRKKVCVMCSNKDFVYKITRHTSIWNINSYGENFLQIFDKYKKFYSIGCDKIAEEREKLAKYTQMKEQIVERLAQLK